MCRLRRCLSAWRALRCRPTTRGREPCRPAVGVRPDRGLRPACRRRPRLRGAAGGGGRTGRLQGVWRHGARLHPLRRRAGRRKCGRGGMLRAPEEQVFRRAFGENERMKSDLKTRHGGRILADALAAQGVKLAFGVPGESYLPVLDGLHDLRERISFIVCRQEGGAAYMAEAYGKLTGEPGVLFVTRGPGATNGAIG